MKMNKILSASISFAILCSTINFGINKSEIVAHADDSYEYLRVDFDSAMVGGGWTYYKDAYVKTDPLNSLNHVYELGNGASQLVKTPGPDICYYGNIELGSDFYINSKTASTNMQLRMFDTAAVDNKNLTWGPKAVQFASGMITVNVGNTLSSSVNIGSYEYGAKYSVKLVLNYMDTTYTEYITGKIDGTDCTNKDVGTYKIPSYTTLGGIYFNDSSSSNASVYLDNIYIHAAPVSYTNTDFNTGDTSLTFNLNQFIDKSSINKLKLTQGDKELADGTDYTISYGTQMAHVDKAVANPTITFTSPVTDPIKFDFSNVSDFPYGRALGFKVSLPISEESKALTAAYTEFLNSFDIGSILNSGTYSAPSVVQTEEYPGYAINVSYEVIGRNTATNETAAKYVTFANDNMIVTNPQVDDVSVDTTKFNVPVEIIATLTLGTLPEKIVKYDTTVPRFMVLKHTSSGTLDDVTTLCDDDISTGHTFTEESSEYVINFDSTYAIGAMLSKGTYTSIKYYVSADGTTYNEPTTYPVSAKSIKLELKGTASYMLSEFEPVTSDYYTSLMKLINDFGTYELTENITNLKNGYITLPNATSGGTALSWSSDNDALDKYGTITQKSTKQTVTLTVVPLDTNRNAIPGLSKTYTATVSAKSSGSSGSSGGGGGGGSSKSSSHSTSSVSSYSVPAATVVPVVVSTPEPEKNAADFTDLTDSYSWAKDAVDYLVKSEVLSGKTSDTFAPADNVTREELVKMAVKAFKINSTKTVETDFSDVGADAWYISYLNKAVAAGIISGTSENTFGAGEYITREDIAVIIKRCADYTGTTLSDDNKTYKFADSAEITNYAYEAVMEMVKGGVMTGYEDNTIRPKNGATRAETAVMLYRIINK